MPRLTLQIIAIGALILSGLSTAIAQAEQAEKTHFTITQVASGPLMDEAISILEAAYSKLGYTIEYEFLQSELALQKSNEGEADGEMVRVVGIERNYPNLVPVPVPYLVAENVLFATEDWGHEVKEWDDLIPIVEDQSVIGVRVGLKKAEQQMSSRNIPYTGTKTTEEAMEMLSVGRLKLVYEERRTGLAIIEKLGLKNVKILEPPLDSVALYHYVHKSNGFLVPKLAQAFKEILLGTPVKKKGVELTKEEQAWLDANHTVRVRVTHWPPYTFNFPEVEGVSIDYWEQFSELFGIDSEYWITDMPFAEAYKDLTGENEYYDLHLTLKRTPDRLKKLAMTRHYFSAPWVIIAAKDREDIGTIEDLNGKLVAIERGYALVELIKDNYPNIKLKLYGTTEEAIDSVAVNETDAYIGNLARALYHINQNSLINLQVVGRTPFGRHQQAIAVRKDWAPLATMFDKWLKTLSSSERNAILNKWVAGYAGPKSKLEKRIALSEEEQAWLLEHPKIRIGAVATSPPYTFRNDQGRYQGIALEFRDYLSEALGFEMEIVPGLSWPEIVEGVRERSLDMVLTMGHRPEREEFVNFTDIYLPTPLVIMRRTGDEQIQSAADLKGRRVALVEGYGRTAKVQEDHPSLIPVMVNSSIEELFAVATGKADAFVDVLGVAFHLARENGITNLEMASLYDDSAINGQRFGVRKDWPELASILDKALLAMSEEKKRQLFERWLPTQAVQPIVSAVKRVSLTAEERAWIKAHPVINVSNEMDYPPYDFAIGGQPQGYSIDILNLLAERARLKIEYINGYAWDQLVDKFRKGELDLLHSLVITPEREKFGNFSDYYRRAQSRYVTRKENPDISHITDLYGKIVAVGKGWMQEEYLSLNHPEINLLPVKNLEEMLDAVATGKAYATIENSDAVRYFIKTKGFDELKISGWSKEIDQGSGLKYYFMAQKDAPELISILNKSLASLTVDEIDKLNRKWFGAVEKETPVISLTAEERAWIKAHSKIRVHNETEWPPFNFAENGQPKGFSIDFMNLVAKKTGLEVDYVTGPSWNEFLEMMKRGDLDVMLNIVKTSERLKYLLYTPSYADNPNVILSKNDKPYKSIESLFGKTVATPKGFFTEEILKRDYSQITVLPLKNMLESMKSVSFGQADAALGELAVFNHLLNQHMMTDMSVSGEADLGDPELSLLHIATRKEHPVLASILTKGVEAVTQEERNALLAKWLMMEKETTIVNLTAEERAWIKGHPVIKVNNEMDWRPFDFNEDSVPSGYSIDLMKLLAERIGIQIEFVYGPTWGEFISALKEKRIDILHAARKTEDREKYSLFTAPYIQSISRFIVHKDSPEIRELSDLEGKTFAAPKGWASLEYLKKNRPDIKLLETDSVYDAFNAVMIGKADATAERDKVARYFISYYGLSDLKISSWFKEFDQNKASGLHIMVRDDWPVLRELLDKALDSLTVEEKLALESRWFGPISVVDDEEPILSETIVFNQATLLIKWISGAFAVLVLLMFVYWLSKGRPKQFSIRLTLLFISAIFAGLIVAIGLLVLMLLRGEQRQEEIENNRYESIQLAYELKQSSDDLTRFARTYVVTGDPKYEEYFQAIIAIRDGKQAHPKDYSHIYWDQVSAGLVEHNAEGETYSLEQRMVELGMSDEEIDMLRQSKYASDELSNLEEVAMNMVRGVYYKDEEDRFTVTTKPNMALARAILHGEKYHAAKANIMMPINEVFVLLKKRTEKELETERANNKAILLVITGMIVATIVFSIYTYILLRRRMVKPLEILKGGALKIESGDYLHQITVDSQDEMGDLSRAFNAMADSVHHRTQDLRAAMKQLELALSAADAGTFIHDYEYDVVKLDERACHHLGIRQSEITFNQFFDNIHPEDAPDVSQFLKDAFASRQEYITVEFRAGGEGHENTQVQVQALIQYNSKTRKLKRSIGIVFDITDRKKAEKEIQEAKDQAEAANKSKSAFLASMSHELRTPLNAVLGFSQLLHADKTLNDQQRANIDIINSSGNHLLQLINDVLDMSKIEAGKIGLMPEDIDLGELVRDVIDMLQVRAQQKGLQLILDQTSNFPRFVKADGPKIRQILINLLNNAIKFTDSGGVTLRLAAKNGEPDRITLHGEVQDTGRGIDPEAIERIFQPFEQLTAAVEQKGTGLGLAITRQFVELMGGEISAASQPDKGTTFYFTINVEPGNPELITHTVAADTSKVIGLKEPAREWRILIVEDQLENQLLLKQLLETTGFHVRIAEDGEKGVEAFQEWQPHFIWMDRRMPRMNGLEATRRIRKLPGGKEVKIVALTASVFKEQKDEVMAAGSDDFVRKPYRPEEIFDCMARHLDLHYVYEDEETPAAATETVDMESITPERVAALPAAVRDSLGKAATRLDIDQAGTVLKQVEEVDPELAAALGQLVERLDFYAIKKLLRQ